VGKTDDAKQPQAAPDIAKAVAAITKSKEAEIPIEEIEAAAGGKLDAAAKQAILRGLAEQKTFGAFASTKEGKRLLRLTRRP